MNSISVCTIYAKRKSHLRNLVRGLIESADYPKELVIVCMNDRLPQLPPTPFKIITANVESTSTTLPLAAARNKAAAIATGNKLIFLDVDCIGDRNLIKIFDEHLEQEEALYSGSVRYLKQDWQQNNWTIESLDQYSSVHELQGKVPDDLQKIAHPYELFWSLNFGISQQAFNHLGGFDEGYKGYGGEDTDFAFTARSHQLPCYKVGAVAYHQYHPTFSPPLNHLADIVSNARVFYHKWGVLPMEKWLRQFVDLGYIKLVGHEISIIKFPTATEIQACQISSQ